MASAPSLRPSPVISLGDHSYKTLFEDDFTTNKSSIKVKAVTPAKGTFNYKIAFDHVKTKTS